ncbi:unnamed protein product [Soboliphyme baturini]|uniref:Pirin family protein n=1 Tax=Soboliphyme baturini TaxID=241478 RepID=A0A183J7Q5_9BILA|nr:unnamed protein product [Soboliphyme baturini]
MKTPTVFFAPRAMPFVTHPAVGAHSSHQEQE